MFTAANKDDAHEKAQRTAQDAKNAGSRVKHELHDSAENLRDDINDLAQTVARKAGRRVRDLADQANDTVSEASDTMVERITDNPLQSVAIAAGVGFVLGMFFRR